MEALFRNNYVMFFDYTLRIKLYLNYSFSTPTKYKSNPPLPSGRLEEKTIIFF